VPPFDQRATRATHPLRAPGIGDERLDRGAQRPRIARRHVDPLNAILDEVDLAPGARDDHGLPHRHRLRERRDACVELHVLERYDDEAGGRIETAKLDRTQVSERNVRRRTSLLEAPLEDV